VGLGRRSHPSAAAVSQSRMKRRATAVMIRQNILAPKSSLPCGVSAQVLALTLGLLAAPCSAGSKCAITKGPTAILPGGAGPSSDYILAATGIAAKAMINT
jgi:hypothetical protein